MVETMKHRKNISIYIPVKFETSIKGYWKDNTGKIFIDNILIQVCNELQALRIKANLFNSGELSVFYKDNLCAMIGDAQGKRTYLYNQKLLRFKKISAGLFKALLKDYIAGKQPHSVQLYNKSRQASFDEYIRGIILGDVLYLRIYYPYEDIDTLTRDKLYKASLTLLKANVKAILEVIQDKENITIKSIKYNVDNDLLRGLKLANI